MTLNFSIYTLLWFYMNVHIESMKQSLREELVGKKIEILLVKVIVVWWVHFQKLSGWCHSFIV